MVNILKMCFLLVVISNMLTCKANVRDAVAATGHQSKLPSGSIFGKRFDNTESTGSVNRARLPGGSIFGKRFDHGESKSIIGLPYKTDADGDHSMSSACELPYRSNLANILAMPPNFWVYTMLKLNSVCKN